MSLRGLGVILLAACLLADASAARADASADEAEARFRRGAELYRARRLDEALLEFLASNRLVHNRNVVYNIATTYEALGRLEEAYRYYVEYLAAEAEPAERAATEARLRNLAGRVALLRVVSDPPGATVYVGRRDLGGRGETPLVLALPPGEHVVLVERPGHEPASATVRLARGAETEARLELPLITGTLIVESTPPGEVRVDRADEDAGPPDAASTPATLRLPPGRHSIEVRAPGHRPRRREIVVKARAEHRVRIPLEAIPPPSGTLVLTTATPGALVVVDGAERGFTPVVLDLVAGARHRVAVRLDGHEEWSREIALAEGERAFVAAELRAREPEVIGATRVAQRVGDAPASVSLIGADEIHAFGYETLADALRGVRGFYESDDRNYRTVGLRGFSRPGDYMNRILVLRDGHVTNDDWVGSGFVGRDLAPDLEDVERIEVVRGPGSTFYGPGAFFGVVQLVSLAPGEGPAVRAGGAVTSDGGTRAFARGATHLQGGIAVSVHASAWRSPGRDHRIEEFADEPSRGWVRGADAEEAQRLALRARSGPVSLQAGWTRRDKEIPTAPFETVFDPIRFAPTGGVAPGTLDERAYVSARWDERLGGVDLHARLSLDRFRYGGRWPYDDEDEPFVLRDAGGGDWAGGEARVAFPAPGRQRITLGAETAAHRVFQSVDELSDGTPELEERRRFATGSIYVVDEVEAGRRVRVTAGLRLDRSGIGDLALSPRAAVVVAPADRGRTKLIVGRAFRAPSLYELTYHDHGVTQRPPDELAPETIWTAELEHSQQLGPRSWVVASAFGSRIQGLIALVTDDDDLLVYENSDEPIAAVGGELEARHGWEGGAWVRAAVSATRLATDDPSARTNSAPLTFAARGYWPARRDGVGVAGELIVNAPRPDREGRRTDAVVLANAWLSGRLGEDLSYRVGVVNLLDRRHRLPAGEEFVQRTIRQDGRTFLLQLAIAR